MRVHQPRAPVSTLERDCHRCPSSLRKRSAGGSIPTCPSSCLNSECPWAAHNKRLTCQASREPKSDAGGRWPTLPPGCSALPPTWVLAGTTPKTSRSWWHIWFTLCGLARTLAAWLVSTMTRPFADRPCLRATDSGKGEPVPVLHLFLRGRPDKQTLWPVPEPYTWSEGLCPSQRGRLRCGDLPQGYWVSCSGTDLNLNHTQHVGWDTKPPIKVWELRSTARSCPISRTQFGRDWVKPRQPPVIGRCVQSHVRYCVVRAMPTVLPQCACATGALNTL